MKKAEQGRSGIFLLNAVLLIHCSKTRMISSKLQIIRVFRFIRKISAKSNSILPEFQPNS